MGIFATFARQAAAADHAEVHEHFDKSLEHPIVTHVGFTYIKTKDPAQTSDFHVHFCIVLMQMG